MDTSSSTKDSMNNLWWRKHRKRRKETNNRDMKKNKLMKGQIINWLSHVVSMDKVVIPKIVLLKELTWKRGDQRGID